MNDQPPMQAISIQPDKMAMIPSPTVTMESLRVAIVANSANLNRKVTAR
jgi:hypothetical protein